MALRFLLDEQISPLVADILRRAGQDAVAVAGSHLSGLDDTSIFREAVRTGRILVTYDIADFVAIYRDFLQEDLNVPGLVLVDSRTIPTAAVGKLARALQRLSTAIHDGDADPSSGIFLSSK